MTGTASVLLATSTLDRITRSKGAEIISKTYFGDCLWQVNLSHPRLPKGYNGQVELIFRPWPDGEIHFRREADV